MTPSIFSSSGFSSLKIRQIVVRTKTIAQKYRYCGRVHSPVSSGSLRKYAFAKSGDSSARKTHQAIVKKSLNLEK